MKIEHTLDSGKYSIKYQMEPHQFEALRHGEPWRDLTGDKLMLSIVMELQDYKDKVSELQALLLQCHSVLHVNMPSSDLKEAVWAAVSSDTFKFNGGYDDLSKSRSVEDPSSEG